MQLTTFRGDTPPWLVPTSWYGVPGDYGDGWNLIWTLKSSVDDPDSAALAQLTSGAGITPIGGSSVVKVQLTPTVTNALPVGKTLHWDIQAQNTTTGEIRTVARGTLYVDTDVTRETTISVPVYTLAPSALDPSTSRAGVIAAPSSGVDAVQVLFSPPFTSPPRTVVVTPYSPTIAYIDPSSITAEGCTIRFAGTVDAGTECGWVAVL